MIGKEKHSLLFIPEKVQKQNILLIKHPKGCKISVTIEYMEKNNEPDC